MAANVAVQQKAVDEARAAVELTARHRRIMEGSIGSCDSTDDDGNEVDDNAAPMPPSTPTCVIEAATAREAGACCARDEPRVATELAATKVPRDAAAEALVATVELAAKPPENRH